ncbi:magnesium transporter [Coraliomargarita sp. W4R53]
MSEANTPAEKPIDSLNRAFLLNYSIEAAKQIALMLPHEAVYALQDQSSHVLAPVFEKLSPGVAEAILSKLTEVQAVDLLMAMDAAVSTILLSRLDEETREHYFSLMAEPVSKELKALLEYPDDSAGKLMQTKFVAFNKNITVEEAIAQIKIQRVKALHRLYLIGDDMRLCGKVDIQRLALADRTQKLSTLATPIQAMVQALDPKDEVVELLKTHQMDALPVVDIEQRLVGTIQGQGLIDALNEDLVTNMQTMVGVSKDERALSTSWFAVKKRLPWLQVNLLTAFLAAAVVGAFEDTIAKYTALAILLPIAAGQSGNTGAQALAVTMRGLTLREVTVKHWLRITLKELGAGLINGVATAITCGLGVYLWSRSIGLSLIIALAMISSMSIAAVAGALVPMGLKRIGQDPALSSSIILTTVTDIAGFLSFLGIATLLSGMLEAS